MLQPGESQAGRPSAHRHSAGRAAGTRGQGEPEGSTRVSLSLLLLRLPRPLPALPAAAPRRAGCCGAGTGRSTGRSGELPAGGPQLRPGGAAALTSPPPGPDSALGRSRGAGSGANPGLTRG